MMQFKGERQEKSMRGVRGNEFNPAILKIFSFFKMVVGNRPDILNFDDRLRLQKITYLLQAAGEHFDYRFTWYVRGPYSAGVTADGYFACETKEKPLDTRESALAGKLSSFLQDVGGPTERILELYASLLFLIKDEGRSPEEAEKKLVYFKPWFSEQEAKEALENMQKSRLFSL